MSLKSRFSQNLDVKEMYGTQINEYRIKAVLRNYQMMEPLHHRKSLTT